MVKIEVPRIEDLSVDDLLPNSPSHVKIAAKKILSNPAQIKRVWVVKSSNNDYNYLVFEMKDGSLKGTCPDAFFRRNSVGALCKHCAYVKEHMDELVPVFDIERWRYGMALAMQGVDDIEIIGEEISDKAQEPDESYLEDEFSMKDEDVLYSEGMGNIELEEEDEDEIDEDEFEIV